MTTSKACTACRYHLAEPCCGSVLHLCTVRHALDYEPDPDETPSETEEHEANFLGWDCDRARRMGELCGPAGSLWKAKP